MDLRIAITDDLNSEREKLSSAIIAPFSKVGLNVGNIDEYTSGEELLRQFSAGRYDLIFLDIYMGGMSGVETAKRIRVQCYAGVCHHKQRVRKRKLCGKGKLLSAEARKGGKHKTACRNRSATA